MRYGAGLIEQYGQDLHTLKAVEMFQVPPLDVTPEMRAAGKRANYIDMYSAGGSLDEFFTRCHPGVVRVSEWQRRVMELVTYGQTTISITESPRSAGKSALHRHLKAYDAFVTANVSQTALTPPYRRSLINLACR